MNLCYFALVISWILCSAEASPETCPDTRTVKKDQETVYITIDDGPSLSRMKLLKAFKEADVKVTFFDSGYQVCNDLPSKSCQRDLYSKNMAALAETVKAGHMLAAHSDNHYVTPMGCNYGKVPPEVRPKERLAKCGQEPIQNMVQGAHQLEIALTNDSITWTDKQKKLREKAIDDIWTYARLPCSNIWRTRGNISETILPGVKNKTEFGIRKKVADEMFSGKVKCRPSKYEDQPWELYGFNNVEWFGATLLNKGEKCRMVKLIEDAMTLSMKGDPEHQGKVVMLTHDYHFTTDAKASVFGEFAKEIKRKGYKVDVMENYHPPQDKKEKRSKDKNQSIGMKGSFSFGIIVIALFNAILL